jgi:hypothetical protein
VQHFTNNDLMIATGVHSVGRTGEVRQSIDQLGLTLRPGCKVLGFYSMTTALSVLTGERLLT